MYYQTEIELKNKDVDPYQNIRLSRLMELMQEASIAHTEELGYDHTTTLDKGYLWVIIQQRVEIRRLPRYDERIHIKSWPGDMMHVLYPRYYRIESEKGEPLVSSSALWMLISKEERRMVFPAKSGVEIEGVKTGEEIALPETLKLPVCEEVEVFKVGFSSCDLNGHMNNTRFFDLAVDHIPEIVGGSVPESIQVQYSNEAKIGTRIHLNEKRENENTYFLSGDAEKNIFKMQIDL